MPNEKTPAGFPILNIPPEQEIQIAELPQVPWDDPIPIRLMSTLDDRALTVNMCLMVGTAILTAVFMLIGEVGSPGWIVLVSLSLGIIPYFLLTVLAKRGWVVPKSKLQGIVYWDPVFKDTTVYVDQANVVPFWAILMRVLDFSNQDGESFCAMEGSEPIKVLSNDNYNLAIEVVVPFKILTYENSMFLGNYLKFTPKEIREFLKADLSSHVNKIASINSFEAMRANQDLMAMWVAMRYGGVEIISVFEKKLGIDLFLNPIFKSIGLTPESKAQAEKKATMDLVSIGANKFIKDIPGVSPDRALWASLASNGVSDMDIRAYDLPPTLHTFVAGPAGLAVPTRRENNKNKNQGKQGKS